MNSNCSSFLLDASGKSVEAPALPADALSLGRGVFETVLILNGRPVFPQRHARRLLSSCEALDIATPAEIRAIFNRALEIAASEDRARTRMRVAVFGDPRHAPAGIVVIRKAAEPKASVRLNIASVRRNANSLLARHKTVNYLENLLARDQAQRAGFDGALWLDADGNVAETSVANIFVQTSGGLVTPSEGCILPGIVRAWVLETARVLGIVITEAQIPAESLARAEAAFVTNAIMGLVAVSQIGDMNFRDRPPAAALERLSAAYRRELAKAAAGTSSDIP